MKRTFAPLLALALALLAATTSAQTAPCDPYSTTCFGGPSGPSFDPYTQPPSGVAAGAGPYARPTGEPLMQWVVNGELYLDGEVHRYGWLIVENLADEPQTAVIEFASEAWRAPAYRLLPLAPHARASVTLHGDPVLAPVYFSARVTFDRRGTTHATFRPYADRTTGQTDAPGVLVP